MKLKPILIGFFVLGFVLVFSIILMPRTAVTETMGECISGCNDECAGLPPADKKACKLACFAGRCEQAGTIEHAGNSGDPGILCEPPDGVCNTFCPEGVDLDCAVCSDNTSCQLPGGPIEACMCGKDMGCIYETCECVPLCTVECLDPLVDICDHRLMCQVGYRALIDPGDGLCKCMRTDTPLCTCEEYCPNLPCNTSDGCLDPGVACHEPVGSPVDYVDVLIDGVCTCVPECELP